jgi:hypothetical protein
MSIFSDIGNAISSVAKAVIPMVINAAFPEAALLGAATQLFGGAIGDVACDIIDKVGQQVGAPKFLTDLAKTAVKQYVSQMQGGAGDVLDHVKDLAGGVIQKFADGMKSDFNDIFEEYKKDFQKTCGTGGKGGASKGESFLVILAKILGDLENKQFAKVVKAGKDVSDALGTSGSTNSNENGQFDKMEKLKGEAQTMSALAQSVSSALDGIFKAASTAAQKVG